jgi:hypothetical protein
VSYQIFFCFLNILNHFNIIKYLCAYFWQCSNLPKEWQGVSVKSIDETATCRYLVDICVAVLCKLETFYDNSFIGTNEENTQTTTVGAGSGSGSSSRQEVAADKNTLTSDCSFHG